MSDSSNLAKGDSTKGLSLCCLFAGESQSNLLRPKTTGHFRSMPKVRVTLD
jgi:hypothetical protein